MWVFGYGSLVWNPGFNYKESRVGFIRGYVRRFWQGNDYHRGRPQKEGRVATLVEDKEGTTWGRAFLLAAEDESSLSYLDTRETKLGGYSTSIVFFQPRDPKESAIPVLLYVALANNRLYKGPSPLPEVASEIAEAHGSCGYNAEYILRLAEFMREQAPDIWDEHLFHLEHLVKARLKGKNLSIEKVMDSQMQVDDSDVTKNNNYWDFGNSDQGQTGRTIPESQSPQRSPDFASRVPIRKLKCLDI